MRAHQFKDPFNKKDNFHNMLTILIRDIILASSKINSGLKANPSRRGRKRRVFKKKVAEREG